MIHCDGTVRALVFLNETWNTKEQRFPFFVYPRLNSSFNLGVAAFSPLKRMVVQHVKFVQPTSVVFILHLYLQ